jgi:CubicO group peptidase (beta-lactamase class C family)
MLEVEKLRQIVERERERFGVAGLSVAVVRDREVVLAEGFGYRDLERDLPATPETLFALASDSKAFTAALCATLVNEGLLDWDRPVREILPWFRLADPHATELVSIRDLLAHRTGIPRHDGLWYWGAAGPSQEEIVRRLRHLEPSTPLRQAWQYNNNCYTVAGYVAGVLAGSDWQTALRDRLITPLGMRRTSLGRAAAAATGDSATPYDRRSGDNMPVDTGREDDINSVGPAGGIWSNAVDMARWAMARLQVPQPDGTLLLSAEALRELHGPAIVKPRGNIELPGVHSLGYALAAEIVVHRGHLLVHHGGNTDGFCSDVYLAPDAGHAVVVLANADASGVRTALPLSILENLLGLDPQPWGERLAELAATARAGTEEAGAHRQARARRRPPTRPLDEFAGTYAHPAYDRFTVTVGDGRLIPEWHGLQGIELRHRDYDTYDLMLGPQLEDMPIPVVFRFGTEGVSGAEIALEPSVSPIFFEREPAVLAREQLERLTGTYLMGQQALFVSVADLALSVQIGGSPATGLIPVDESRFAVAGNSAMKVQFLLRDDEVHEVVVEPLGIFRPPADASC